MKQNHLTLAVGPYEYAVSISKKPLYHEGKKAAGLTMWNERQILVCRTIAPERREEVLFHEVIEAWIMHVGKPEDKEQLCDWGSTIMYSFQKDAARWGGVKALTALASPTAKKIR